MDYFYVITNEQKDAGLETTRRIQEYLLQHGRECQVREFQMARQRDMVREETVCARAPGEAREKGRYTNIDLIPEKTQCILVLGGDGTLIQAARDTLERQIPLLGINMGTLGYLAEIEKNHLEYALDCLMADRYLMEERMMLYGRVFRDGQMVSEDCALNDIVISRYGSLRVVSYQIRVNGAFLNAYAADGMIVATPTGSTGYSLSAGGPIVSPSAAMTILTPICPHTLNTRSIVLSAQDRIRIEIDPEKAARREEALVAFDGEQAAILGAGDYVEIERAGQVTRILKISNASFLEVLRSKMREN